MAEVNQNVKQDLTERYKPYKEIEAERYNARSPRSKI